MLTDVSFEVGEGEVFGLLGPNGAGKTTLVEILATLVSPTGGVASIHGHDVVGQAAAVRTLIGLVPADSETLYPRLTGRENLRFLVCCTDCPARSTEARVDELLGLVGLTDDGATRVERYSDGMKARLSLARGLVADPRVLLLDEPTRALDPIAKRTVRRFVVDELAARRREDRRLGHTQPRRGRRGLRASGDPPPGASCHCRDTGRARTAGAGVRPGHRVRALHRDGALMTA